MNQTNLFSTALALFLGFSSVYAQQPDLRQGTSVSITGTCTVSGNAYIQNSGNANAGAYKAELWAIQECLTCNAMYKLSEITSTGLLAGEEETYTFSNLNLNGITQHPSFQANENNYRIYVTIDADEEVSESNETNNVFSIGTVQCVLGASAVTKSQLQTTQLTLITNQSTLQCGFEIEQIADCQLQMIDITGNIVYKQEISQAQGKQNHEIQVANFAQGVYFVTLTTPAGRISKKVVL